jgi:hypothetical protein
MVVNFCQENTFCIETCFFQVFHQRNHCSKLACGLGKCTMGNSLHTNFATSAKQIVLWTSCWIYQPSFILCNESLIRGIDLNVNASGVFGQTWCTIYAFVHPAICNLSEEGSHWTGCKLCPVLCRPLLLMGLSDCNPHDSTSWESPMLGWNPTPTFIGVVGFIYDQRKTNEAAKTKLMSISF